MMKRAIAIVFILLASAPAHAVLPDEVLADPVLESRARALSKNIRCLVCQNQSIDNSNADLARDLRILVRERLKSGDSDRQILDFLIARYGDFIMLKPPFKGITFLLWFGPAIVFVASVSGLFVYFRRRRSALAEPSDSKPSLSSAERDRLASLLDGPEGNP
jgi:cytochrome c-type biogenesis protein CcmH